MTERSYPPDYVSAETLAYRLDCEVSMIEALMRKGALPRPRMIGDLPRWDFNVVRTFIDAKSGARLGRNGRPGPDADPYLAALEGSGQQIPE